MKLQDLLDKQEEHCDHCRSLHESIQVIEKLDRIKLQLSHLNSNSRYIDTIRNKSLRRDIERIFGLPFENSMSEYLRLLNTRNKICHKYTMRGFEHSPTDKAKLCF